MSKTHGMGAGLLVGGYDISGDIGAVQRIACPRSVLDVTDITQEAYERRLALKDGGLDYTAYFNPDADRAHDVLSDLPRTDTVAMYLHRRTAQSTPTACMVAKQLNYDPNRTQDGALVLAVSMVSNGFGLEWADLLTVGLEEHESDGEDGTSVDDGAGTSFGLQAYLQVLDFDGTTVDISVQHSSDNGAGDAFADITGAVFSGITAAPYAERKQTARNTSVERYLRVSTTGTFTSVTFALAVVRNTHTVNF